jgi:predicted nucleotidyltransferase
MQLDRPFRVVSPTVDGDVLAVLARAEAEFTPPEVHRLIGAHSEDGVRRALVRLADQGIVLHRRAGRAGLYQLNRDHLAAAAVIDLASLKDQLLARCRERLASWQLPARYVALFGSAAHGHMHLDSDLDILVVRPDRVDADADVWRRQLSTLASDLHAWTGNEARILELADSEAAAGVAAGERVLLDIASGGIHLAGPLRYLSASRHRSAR